LIGHDYLTTDQPPVAPPAGGAAGAALPGFALYLPPLAINFSMLLRIARLASIDRVGSVSASSHERNMVMTKKTLF
jgi:hypothetical protein